MWKLRSEKDEEGGHWRSYEGDDDKPGEVARQFMDSKRSEEEVVNGHYKWVRKTRLG